MTNNSALKSLIRNRQSSTPNGYSEKKVCRGIERVFDQIANVQATVKPCRNAVLDADNVANALKDSIVIPCSSDDGYDSFVGVPIDIISAVIEQQTYGAILGLDLSGRRLTATDQAVVAPVFETMTNLIVEMIGLNQINAYKTEDAVNDFHTLKLLMRAGQYHWMEFEIKIADGVIGARIQIALPDNETPETNALQAPTVSGALNKPLQLQQAEIRFHAVLSRVPFSVSRLQNLHIGQRVELSANMFRRINLETEMGQKIFSARLGQVGGYRALKLVDQTKMDVPAKPFSALDEKPSEQMIDDLPHNTNPSSSGPLQEQEDASIISEADILDEHTLNELLSKSAAV